MVFGDVGSLFVQEGGALFYDGMMKPAVIH
jgi:hypothetical protein